MSTRLWSSITQFIILLLIVLMCLAYFQFYIRTPGQFYGKMPDDKYFLLTALDRPNVSTNAMLIWATLAATGSFTFDFVNYEKQLAALKDYFTNDGYNKFVQSLQETKTIDTITEKKLIVSAVAVGPAIVLLEEQLGENRSWRVQVPILVRYQSANVNETTQQIVELLITQVSTRDAPKGIGIAQYVARQTSQDI